MHQCGGRRVSRFLYLLLSRRRQVSPTDTFFPPSSRRRQVSPIQAPEIPESPIVPEAQLPPPTVDVAESVPPLEGEAVTDAKPEAFGIGLVCLSLLPLYPDHTAKHIWVGEVALVVFIFF